MGSRSFCRPVTTSAAINREPVREGGPGRDDPPRAPTVTVVMNQEINGVRSIRPTPPPVTTPRGQRGNREVRPRLPRYKTNDRGIGMRARQHVRDVLTVVW